MIRSAQCGLFLAVALATCAALSQAASPYARWTNGPAVEAGFFPIAVWLQNPSNAERYRRAGINTYVGLWRGPTVEQLATLKKAGIKLVCSQNPVALQHLGERTIIGWMHGDEPDNAQSLGGGKGYGPPIKPEKIIVDYERLRAADPSRPVLLNLGQGVAWDNWIGRGVRRNHPEDYPEYLKGCDIASFDIYPAVHDHAEVAGKLWFVPYGVERLIKWSDGEKIVWNCIEASRIDNTNAKPTVAQIRAEVWMSIIHGSRGLIYFVHQFKPVFREASLLDDPDLLGGVTALNQQVTELAPVINSGTTTNLVRVESADTNVPISALVKEHDGLTYVFAAAMRPGKTSATFVFPRKAGPANVEVLFEGRSLALRQERFTDTFDNWAVHLYKLGPAAR